MTGPEQMGGGQPQVTLPTRRVGTVRSRSLPDIEAARKIPIENVIALLPIKRFGRMLRCWRPDEHEHGDRTPSVGIWQRKNKVKCFVCDPLPLSTVDLVKSVVGVETYPALQWLDKYFQIPQVPKGKHLVDRVGKNSSGRVGMSASRLESLVRSGLWAAMTHAERTLLVVLDVFADHTNSCRLSYMALRRYTGLRKDSTVAKATRRLENMHVVEIARGKGGNGINRCNVYTLTLEDSRLLASIRASYEDKRAEIEVQRHIRAERRARISLSLREKYKTRRTPGITGTKLSAVERSSSQMAASV